MQVLSAERYDPVSLNAYGNSFMYIRKRSGPKINPHGTPQFISATSHKKLSVSEI